MDLINAAQNGNLNVVRSILDKGTDINIKDSFGASALDRASIKGHIDVVKMLIANGWTALIWASSKGHTEIVKILIENGAYVNAISNKGLTALSHAKANYHKEIVEILEKGQNQN